MCVDVQMLASFILLLKYFCCISHAFSASFCFSSCDTGRPPADELEGSASGDTDDASSDDEDDDGEAQEEEEKRFFVFGAVTGAAKSTTDAAKLAATAAAGALQFLHFILC